MEYLCNCGGAFPSNIALAIHAQGCPAWQEALARKKALEMNLISFGCALPQGGFCSRQHVCISKGSVVCTHLVMSNLVTTLPIVEERMVPNAH